MHTRPKLGSQWLGKFTMDILLATFASIAEDIMGHTNSAHLLCHRFQKANDLFSRIDIDGTEIYKKMQAPEGCEVIVTEEF